MAICSMAEASLNQLNVATPGAVIVFVSAGGPVE
jgi:hypothetical protein